MEQLFSIGNGLSKHQHSRRWKLLAQHFTIRGKPVTPHALRNTARNTALSKTGKPKGHEVLEAMVTFLSKLPEDTKEGLLEAAASRDE